MTDALHNLFLIHSMKTPINAGLLQTDLDCAGFDLLNFSGGGGGSSGLTGAFNVMDAPYNATGDGTTNDTAAIQAALNDADASGGAMVLIPVGTFSCNPLTFTRKVRIVGLHPILSVIKARASGTLLSHTGVQDLSGTTNFENIQGPQVENLTLEGNSVGTIGLQMRDTHHVHPTNVSAYRFTDAGIEMKGTICSTLVRCRGIKNATGFRWVNDPSPPPAVYPGNFPTNLDAMIDCVMFNNTFRGLDYTGGYGLILQGITDVESNGTAGNANAGGLYISATAITPGAHGLVQNGILWAEANNGGFNIKFAAVTATTVHQLNGAYLYNIAATPTRAILLEGTGGGANILTLSNVLTASGDAQRSVYRTGANAIVYSMSGNDVVHAGGVGTVFTPNYTATSP
jgi:hypothetical protein